jgi:Flp pilus assembly pilin Flp
MGIDSMFTTIAKLLKNEDGATAIEYGLIAALISIAAVAVMGHRRHEPQQHL